MPKTKIEWCDYTINPVIGCSKCSPGCNNCYAEKMAARLAKIPGTTTQRKYQAVTHGGKWNGEIHYDPSCLSKLPRKPARVFVGSMTDVFHENFDFDKQVDLINQLANFPHLTFCLLTKRPENARRVFESFALSPANIWLGVTVCNLDEADEKIPILLNTPAVKCFISIEPCLSNIDLYTICHKSHALDWVILGGENGSGARPLHPDWARNMRDHCKKLAIPFFFKGWGEYLPYEQMPEGHRFRMDEWHCGEHFQRTGKAKSGRLLDGIEHSEVPE